MLFPKRILLKFSEFRKSFTMRFNHRTRLKWFLLLNVSLLFFLLDSSLCQGQEPYKMAIFLVILFMEQLLFLTHVLLKEWEGQILINKA